MKSALAASAISLIAMWGVWQVWSAQHETARSATLEYEARCRIYAVALRHLVNEDELIGPYPDESPPENIAPEQIRTGPGFYLIEQDEGDGQSGNCFDHMENVDFARITAGGWRALTTQWELASTHDNGNFAKLIRWRVGNRAPVLTLGPLFGPADANSFDPFEQDRIELSFFVGAMYECDSPRVILERIDGHWVVVAVEHGGPVC
ncbi:hypothetical protein L5876_12540 [Hyphobacterium sp. SN044]|uniref:hypothetical protein n=1 Tax=Hyphobacterium sp. SN044 TaxID=2912575 RepID=UPI001F32FC40|nr:hypothetical protein [Hyphobacterium sp. SN044]MCF8880646.1 hypothetical protein [Hyphobacterium sp. SN044]